MFLLLLVSFSEGDIFTLKIKNSSFSQMLKSIKPKRGASQVELVVKSPPVNAADIRDTGSIPGSRRLPGGGHGNSLQYSCLENPMDRGAGRLQSVGSQGVRHNWSNCTQAKEEKSLSIFTFNINSLRLTLSLFPFCEWKTDTQVGLHTAKEVLVLELSLTSKSVLPYAVSMPCAF